MRQTSKFLVVSLAAIGVAAGAGIAGASSSGPDPADQANTQHGPDTAPHLPEAFVRGQAALDRVGDRLPVVAAKYGMNPGELRRALLEDPTLAMDRSQRLAYFDVKAPDDDAPTVTSSTAEGDPFALASLPGADKTIYLDFDGHVTTGTTWNSASGRTSISTSAYSRDGDTGSFNAEELQIIRDSWAVVAEDFAPWNVNVTTIDPGVDALRRSGGGDTRWGVRVVVTGDDWDDCECGGFAYLGSFDDTADEPVFVFNSSFVGVSEAASHEVGHALLLNHDGQNPSTGYYRGHDSPDTPGWAPIMGASYYEPVTQWSRQEYFGANNTGQDDLAIIGSMTNGNNFGLRADDHGDTSGTATPLTTQQVDQAGIISTRADVDVFTFTTAGGGVSFLAYSAETGSNLDIELTLRDGSGAVVASDNISDELDAGFDANVGPGTYTVTVDGIGVGDPSTNPPTGYTDYASLGQYQLLGYIGGIGDPEPDTEPPAAPTGLTAVEGDGDVDLAWDANTEPDLAGYEIDRAPSAAGPFTRIGTTAGATTYTDVAPDPGSYHYLVRSVDTSGNVSVESAGASVEVAEPPVDLSRHASAETTVAGTTSGTFTATTARDGSTQTITEVSSGGKPKDRHDLAEHRWSIPASLGNQTLTVVATASPGSDADAGFVIEYSHDGGTWIPFATVADGTALDHTASIGAPTGPVTVRVVDTDRSGRNTSFNSISVDLLEIVGDGETVEPPTATMTVASLSTSTVNAGRGAKHGVVTVQVTDDLGQPVAGANVTIALSGSFTGTMTGATNPNGIGRFTTTSAVKKPSFSACVVSLTEVTLDYAPGTEACP